MPPLDLAKLEMPPGHLATLLGLLEAHVPDAEVWAYGSRVNGDGHAGSDLDLVLRNPRELSAPVAGLSELVSALQASSLPMLVEVSHWAALPAAFHRNIEQGYLVLTTGEALPKVPGYAG